MALGVALCYLEPWIAERRGKLTSVLSVVLLVISLLLGSLPFCVTFPDTWQATIKTEVWDYTQWCTTLAAFLIIVANFLAPLLQKVMSLRLFRFLGYISFSLYLLHALVIGSFSSWLFLKLFDSYGYNTSVLIVFLSSTAVLLPCSWLMARFVDQPGILLAKRVYGWVKNPGIAQLYRLDIKNGHNSC